MLGDEMLTETPPQAVIHTSERRRGRLPVIWMVPLVAVLIAAWLAWDTLSKRGPTIAITLNSAEGLTAGQSPLKFKDITFGTVTSFALSPDRRRVLVTVATTREAEPLLTEGTVFWVVKPRLFAGSLSGLDTLLSGSYLQLLPAAAPGPARRSFVGLEDPPVLQSEVAGRTFLLTADRIGSIGPGSPIFFRDMSVGEVLGWDVNDMAKGVTIHAFVRKPFDSYVENGSHFWNASGLSVKMGGAGVSVELESLRALLLGGIAFDTPDEQASGAESAEQHAFPLFANFEAVQNASYSRRIHLVSYFQGSVRGLEAGADVTLHGLKIGAVTKVGLTYDPKTDSVMAPVRYDVQPERFVGIGKKVSPDLASEVDQLAARGLRATLQSASLITGQMMVSLDFVPDAPPASVGRDGDAFVLPSVDSGGFSGITAGATALLAKVNAIPFGQIGKSLNDTLQGLSNVANGPQLKGAMVSLSATVASAQDMVRKLDAGMTPMVRRLPELTADLQRTLAQANQLTASLDSGYGNNTKFNRDLDRLLMQTSEAVRSVAALSDLLSRHPEALVRGRTDTGAE